jgi:hypothetical protein
LTLEKEVPQRVLCQRCQRFIKELFHFVVDLRLPPDNNAAERAIRPLTVSRKISGGTSSARASETKGILASLFGTWRLQGLNPFIACSKRLMHIRRGVERRGRFEYEYGKSLPEELPWNSISKPS